MSRAAHKLLSASGGKGYEIDQSLMFDKTDGAYLIRDDGDITDGNKRTFTFATWFKKVQVGINDILFFARNGGGNELFGIYVVGSAETLWVYQKRPSDSQTIWYLEPTQKIRDVGAWYHFVIAVDTTQSTEADRVKLYINGTQVTSFTGGSSYPDQNSDTPCNNDSFDHQIGYNASAGLNGYLAETYLIDGTAQAASAFGETDEDTGAWIPKKYTGSYGNNGFYLKYKSGAIGTDSSGNGNNYTATNLANADVMLDTPTNNYPTINSIEPYNSTMTTISQGNLHVAATAYDGFYGNHIATVKVPESGKWYIETRMAVYNGTGNTSWIGVMPQTAAIIPKDGTGVVDGEYHTNSAFTGMTADLIATVDTIRLFNGGSAQATVSSATATSYIIALALDVDNNKVYGGYDSGSGITWLASGNPAAGSNGQSHTFTSDTIIQIEVGPKSDGTSNSMQTLNFGQNGTFSGYETAGGNTDGSGQGNFFYSPPSGFKALCSKNLPSVTIKKPTEHFNTVLYTGTGSTRSVTGVGFQAGMTWIKARSTSDDHRIADVVRGSTKQLDTNNDDAEVTQAEGIKSLDSDGFTIGTDPWNQFNVNNTTYVAWNWKAGGSGSANTDGSINSTVSANTTAGFSIVTWTGDGSTATVGHGLGAVPQVYIMKRRDSANYWWVGTTAIDGSHDYAVLDTAVAFSNSGLTVPTSSVFYTDGSQNTNNATYVAYAFAEVEGFSKYGVYTGNGDNTDGPFVNLGFKPAWLMIHTTAGGVSWIMLDNKRDPHNPAGHYVLPDLSNAEADFDRIDFLSNGFKLRQSYTGDNSNGVVYFYMAFASSPFSYSNAR